MVRGLYLFPICLCISTSMATEHETPDEITIKHMASITHAAVPPAALVDQPAPNPITRPPKSKLARLCALLSCCATTTGIGLEIAGKLSDNSPMVRAGQVLETAGKVAGAIS